MWFVNIYRKNMETDLVMYRHNNFDGRYIYICIYCLMISGKHIYICFPLIIKNDRRLNDIILISMVKGKTYVLHSNISVHWMYLMMIREDVIELPD